MWMQCFQAFRVPVSRASALGFKWLPPLGPSEFILHSALGGASRRLYLGLCSAIILYMFSIEETLNPKP